MSCVSYRAGPYVKTCYVTPSLTCIRTNMCILIHANNVIVVFAALLFVPEFQGETVP